MAETKIDKEERKTLTPTWVGEPQQLPNSQVKVLHFNADDGLQYETFKASLFPYILIGQPIDADTELRITTTAEGTQYPHWRVVRIYKDGKPISSEKGGQQYRGRDEDRTDTRTRIMEIGRNWIAGLYKADNPLVVWYNSWLLSGIGEQIKPTKTEKPEVPSLEKKQPKIEPSVALKQMEQRLTNNDPQTFPELRQWAVGIDKSYTLTWMVNTVKIPEAELRAKPNECFHKIKKLLQKNKE